MAVANEAITRFLTRMSQANRSKSREVVLTLDEAVALGTGISQLLNESNDLQRQVLDLLNRAPTETIEVGMDGGGFR